MSSERNVLAACLNSREAWEKVMQVGDTGFGEQGRIIMEHIGDFYAADDEAMSCDSDIVARSIGRRLSNPKHREVFEDICTDLSSMDVSPINVVRDMIGVKRQAVGSRLASALAAGREVEEVRPIIAEYETLAEAETLDNDESEVLQGADVGDLVRTSYEGNLIRVWPTALNDRLDGGCLPGHHILVFARPEAGKTLTLINMIAGFLHQDKTVLYIGNEDPIQDIVIRVVTRLTGLTKYEVFEDPDTADAVARTKGYDNLILATLAPGTPQEIEALLREFEPDVLVIDQLRNLNVGEEHFVQKLEKAATVVRNIGKRHNVLVVSATQAGDSATGKAVLEMGDVDSSNTGIPAQADVMLGVGGTDEDFSMDRRVLSMPKNKRSGRHDFFPVQFDPALSKIRGLD